MMTIFLFSVAIVLVVSAFCSVSEAALYAVRRPFVRQIAEQGSRAGGLLLEYKDNMARPISAILIVNTIANTAGASVAGGQARILFGEAALIWFSVAFTLAVLLFSEIVPKIVGVAYSQPVAKMIAVPWSIGINLLSPFIWIIQQSSKFLKPERTLFAPEEEVDQIAKISEEEGSILPHEAKAIRHVLRLDQRMAYEIMTPRSVVMKLPSHMTLREVSEQVKDFTYSRIPVYDSEEPEIWAGVIFSRDILSGLASDQFDTQIRELCKPIFYVSETTQGHVLLKSFLNRRSHLFGVVDEFGNISGIVTLEDVIETMIGEEIVDEVDIAVDMQELAIRREQERMRESTESSDDAEKGDI